MAREMVPVQRFFPIQNTIITPESYALSLKMKIVTDCNQIEEQGTYTPSLWRLLGLPYGVVCVHDLIHS